MEKTKVLIACEDFFSFISAFQVKYNSYNEDDVEKMELIMQQMSDEESDSVVASFDKIKSGFTEIDSLIQGKFLSYEK